MPAEIASGIYGVPLPSLGKKKKGAKNKEKIPEKQYLMGKTDWT